MHGHTNIKFNVLCFFEVTLCFYYLKRVSEFLKSGRRLTSKIHSAVCDSDVRDSVVRDGFICFGNPKHRHYMACVGSVCF
jgi:hypothetical protein